ncbi:hypothetical protein HYW82_02490 [Candidatus Peregrinibacteria bacterium]|nr:hypothetical protein [Candidatus Peregrinibacteria bacterium]
MIDYLKKPRRTYTKITLSAETEKAVRSLIITLSAMIVVLAVAFLAFTNKSSQKGYTLEQIKLKNEELKTDNSNITAKLTDSTAFSKLEDSGQIEKMQEAESKTYVTEKDNRVN